MNIFEALAPNPSFTDAMTPGLVHRESVPRETERPSPERDARSWSEVTLIEMLPIEHRAEAQEILTRDPNKVRILEMCKLGTFDCWRALERLGMERS